MPARSCLIILALLSLGFTPAGVAAATRAKQKSSKTQQRTIKSAHKSKSARSHSLRKKRAYLHHISNRLVPPPPAYMPSILPERYYHGPSTAAQTEEEEDDGNEVAAKPKNPYSKYFYSAQGDVPKATQARSGVTTWTTLR